MGSLNDVGPHDVSIDLLKRLLFILSRDVLKDLDGGPKGFYLFPKGSSIHF